MIAATRRAARDNLALAPRCGGIGPGRAGVVEGCRDHARHKRQELLDLLENVADMFSPRFWGEAAVWTFLRKIGGGHSHNG